MKEAATIGLLENIQNIALHNGIAFEQFEQYMKPETKEYWNELNKFWDKLFEYKSQGLI